MSEIKKEFSFYKYASKIVPIIQTEELAQLELPIALYRFEKTKISEYERDFKKHIVYARPLLYTLMCEAYDLSSTFGTGQPFPLVPSQLSTEKGNEKIIIRPTRNECAISKTMKTHFDTFFGSSVADGMRVSLSGRPGYKVHFVNYMDILLFSLLYIFQDGRDYWDYDAGKRTFPRFKLEKSCSLFSYKTAFNQVLSLYNKQESKKCDDRDVVFYMIQLNKIDSFFKFFKINSINNQRNHFMRESTFQFVLDNFDLKYSEVIDLEGMFKREVFENDEFIDYCMRTDFHEPLQVFTILFKTYLTTLSLYKKTRNDFDYDSLPGDINFFDSGYKAKDMTLKDLIAFCKKKTKDSIEAITIEVEQETAEEDTCGFDIYQWHNYYFKDRKVLDMFSNSVFSEDSSGTCEDSEENNYLEYLANRVIKILPRTYYQ